MMRVAAIACALACVLTRSAFADDKDKLVGSWKLVAFYVQASGTNEKKDALGPNPVGRLIVAPNGAITNFRVAAERKPAADSDGRGWAKDVLGHLCLDQTGKLVETCQRDGEKENYLSPEDHRVGVRLTGPVPPTAIWIVSTSWNDCALDVCQASMMLLEEAIRPM